MNLEKDFYNLNEITGIVNLKYRQLHNRFISIKQKYSNRKDLLFKKQNKWYIHHSIVNDFRRYRKQTIFVLFTTISSKNRFEEAYWGCIIKNLLRKLKKIEVNSRIKFVIENTKKNIAHLHFMTTFSNKSLLRNLIKDFILTDESNDMNQKIIDIYDVDGLNDYFEKQNKPVLLK